MESLNGHWCRHPCCSSVHLGQRRELIATLDRLGIAQYAFLVVPRSPLISGRYGVREMASHGSRRRSTQTLPPSSTPNPYRPNDTGRVETSDRVAVSALTAPWHAGFGPRKWCGQYITFEMFQAKMAAGSLPPEPYLMRILRSGCRYNPIPGGQHATGTDHRCFGRAATGAGRR